MNNIVTTLPFLLVGVTTAMQYLLRKIGGILFVYSLLKLRTIPNELLIGTV